jgi:hypothetical protein
MTTEIRGAGTGEPSIYCDRSRPLRADCTISSPSSSSLLIWLSAKARSALSWSFPALDRDIVADCAIVVSES